MNADAAAFLKIARAFPDLTVKEIEALIRDAFRAIYDKRGK